MSKVLNFSKAHVLVAGDVMLDRYWHGDSTRISPEAPVPVVRIGNVKEVPGGAANVALNIAGLGGHCDLLSTVGHDREGDVLEGLLRASGVDPVLLRDPSLPTTVKLRIVARNQQMLRADFEGRPNHETMLPLVELFANALKLANSVAFSDYGKGGLTHLKPMMDAAERSGVPILVDPKGADYSSYKGATVVTPNQDEFELVTGPWHDEYEFEKRAFALRDTLQLVALLVTRSEEGMSLFLGSQHIRIPAQAVEVYDVSGAGDTVVATMATAMAVGKGIEESARLANAAAGIVVAKTGTSPITLGELESRI